MFEDIIREAQSKAEAAKEVNPNDYVQDGLLYCFKCHKPKEAIIPFPWGESKCAVQCDCQQEAYRKEREHMAAQAKAERISRLKERGFTDKTLLGCSFEQDDGSAPEFMRKMQNYCKKFDQMREMNKGLLLFGTVGTGKTFAAACIANELMNRGVPCIVTSFPRIVNALQSSFENKQMYLDDLNDCDLLVIDDFSVERQTEYVQEIIYEVIDSRYKAGYPMIVTTNLTAAELKNPKTVMQTRLYSRLLEMCHPIEVKGTDRRRKAVARSFAEMESLLGGD